MDKVILTAQNGQTFTINSPTLGRIKRLGKILGVNLFKDGLDNFDFSRMYEDEVLVPLMGELFEQPPSQDEVTAVDITKAVTAFFVQGRTTTQGPASSTVSPESPVNDPQKVTN